MRSYWRRNGHQGAGFDQRRRLASSIAFLFLGSFFRFPSLLPHSEGVPRSLFRCREANPLRPVHHARLPFSVILALRADPSLRSSLSNTGLSNQ